MRRVMRVSLRHSKRDLVAQEMGLMHQVSRSSSVILPNLLCFNTKERMPNNTIGI